MWHWTAFEMEMNQRKVRVYELKADVVRMDSTTASGYVLVTEDGLFQFGHSKDHRPDLPQVKVVQSVLDPFVGQVATQAVLGEKADDPLYIPAIRQVREGLGKRGLLYVGDSKLTSLDNRAYLQANHYVLQPFVLAPKMVDPRFKQQGQYTAAEVDSLRTQIRNNVSLYFCNVSTGA